MTLGKDEYEIQGDGIWISKAALEDMTRAYDNTRKSYALNSVSWWLFTGKHDLALDLLKLFEPLEP